VAALIQGFPFWEADDGWFVGYLNDYPDRLTQGHDFDGIKVLAPSWADEFVSGLKKEYTNDVQCINTENPSVKASLEIIE